MNKISINLLTIFLICSFIGCSEDYYIKKKNSSTVYLDNVEQTNSSVKHVSTHFPNEGTVGVNVFINHNSDEPNWKIEFINISTDFNGVYDLKSFQHFPTDIEESEEIFTTAIDYAEFGHSGRRFTTNDSELNTLEISFDEKEDLIIGKFELNLMFDTIGPWSDTLILNYI